MAVVEFQSALYHYIKGTVFPTISLNSPEHPHSLIPKLLKITPIAHHWYLHPIKLLITLTLALD